ncbi:MAG: translation initiation factor IF-2 [Rickettsiales bacterium]|nr:translation initiation factor IF-2 [Rickettsiales bacterium]RPG12783.1 MAG: translation initiation factor IF-2 [Pelagibacteraceae bacterium TMED195]|tara:strand:- start:2576 stop:4942 length:2367 start_codon:yes stop_codon:yes gene_type:complete
MEENKDKKTENSGKLQLKKTFNVGQIKQSFSHGRTRSVSVEVKKKRVLRGLEDKTDLSKKIFKENDDFQSLSKNQSLDDQKDLKKNNINDQKDTAEKSNDYAKKEKLNQPDKKDSKKFSNSQTERPNFPNPQNEKEEKFKSQKFAKVPKSFENRRQGKLTISEALSDENEKVRSLAAVRRAREKAKLRTLNNLENKEVLENKERKKKEIIIPDVIAVGELASRMAEKSSTLIKMLMKLGVMSTINETIDGDTAELLVIELGHTPKRVSESDVELGLDGKKDTDEDLVFRPPVVTIMGHVDHGKTSILDAIRQKKVASTEAGGITQHIGSYIVESKGKKITFIDTPGHAAFSQMRARGSNITDIIILVVAGDDSVNEQTIEAISHAKASKCPIIVAINKIDLETSNPQKVENDLMKHEIISEKMGGENVFVNVSAKTKKGLDELLDSIQLQAEIMELKANPNRSAEGSVIESKIEKGKGTVVSILIEKGTLNVGDVVVVGKEWGKVKALYDDEGKLLPKALPSYPVEVVGLSGAPESGEKLVVVESESRAREVTHYRSRMKRIEENSSMKRVSIDQILQDSSGEKKVLISVIIKTDVHGSKEAIEQSLKKMNSDKIEIKIVHSGVGEINESDVTLATASAARIFGFSVKANVQAKNLAKREKISIKYFSIIYEVIDEANKIIDGMFEEDFKEELAGKGTIKKVFEMSDSSKVAGCLIEEGRVTTKSTVKIFREEKLVNEVDIQSLRREKNQVKEVLSGLECGIGFYKFNEIQENDKLEFYLRVSNDKAK